MVVDFFATAGPLENHAQSECSAALGGYACMAFEAPKGFAYFLSGPLASTSRQFDTRPNGSSPMQVWLMHAVRVSWTPARPLSKSILNFFLNRTGHMGMWLDRGRQAVAWTAGRSVLPDGGHLLGVPTWHIHTKDATGAFIFQGRPDQVFVDLAAVLPGNAEIEGDTQPWYGADKVALVKESIRQRQTLPDAAHLACSFYDTATADATAESTSMYYLSAHEVPQHREPIV